MGGKGPQVVDGFSMALNLLSIGWMREGDSLLTMSGYRVAGLALVFRPEDIK